MRIGFHTLGCKLNQYETEALASSFRGHGHVIVTEDEEAEAYIINTCTVTGQADHKSRAVVRSLSRKHPHSLLIVTGCSAQLEAEALSSLGGNILVVPQSAKGELLRLAETVTEAAEVKTGLAQLHQGPVPAAQDPFAFRVKGLSFHTRAFLKVQDGCDAWCAYCRVPQARGPSRSLAVDEVVRRAADLESLGHREIVLTGVNISSYRCGDVVLPRLIREPVGRDAPGTVPTVLTRARIHNGGACKRLVGPQGLRALSSPCPVRLGWRACADEAPLPRPSRRGGREASSRREA